MNSGFYVLEILKREFIPGDSFLLALSHLLLILPAALVPLASVPLLCGVAVAIYALVIAKTASIALILGIHRLIRLKIVTFSDVVILRII